MKLLIALIIMALSMMSNSSVVKASWYSLPGQTTASGEVMDPSELTAAHKTLPFDTKVLVENVETGSKVVVRINDRGPFIDGRDIDLSKGAAEKIGIIDSGVADVRLTIL